MNDAEPMFRCPECNRGVINRRVRNCLFCCAALPEAFLLQPAPPETDEQRARPEQDPGTPSGADTAATGVAVGIDILGDTIDLLGSVFN